MPERFDIALLLVITAQTGALFEPGLRTGGRIDFRPVAVVVPGRFHRLLGNVAAAGARLFLKSVLGASRGLHNLPRPEVVTERRNGESGKLLLCRLVRKVLAALRTRPVFDGTRLGARRSDRIVMGEDVLLLLLARGKHAERHHGGSGKREQSYDLFLHNKLLQ